MDHMINTSIEKFKLMKAIEDFFFDKDRSSVLQDIMIKLQLQADRKKQVESVFEKLKQYKFVLAGGAITSTFSGQTINDLDFYLEDSTYLGEAKAFLESIFKEKAFTSSNCITYKRKSASSRKMWRVQLITRFKGAPSTIFSNFDFTITTGAFRFSTDTFEFGERFFQDLSAKRLTYMGASKYPICAMFRSKKYQERGYSLPGSTVMHISLAIIQLDIKTYGELKEQLLGIDTIYLQNLFSSPEFAPDLPIDYGIFISEAFDRMHIWHDEEEHDE